MHTTGHHSVTLHISFVKLILGLVQNKIIIFINFLGDHRGLLIITTAATNFLCSLTLITCSVLVTGHGGHYSLRYTIVVFLSGPYKSYGLELKQNIIIVLHFSSA